MLGLTRRGERVSERDACLSAALTAQERIESDLRQLLIEPGAEPVAVAAAGDGLAFWIFDAAHAGAVDFPACALAYRVNGEALERVESGRIDRVCAPIVRGARFAAVRTPTGVQVGVELRLSAEGRSSTTHFSIRLPVSADLCDPALQPTYRFHPMSEFPAGSLRPGPRLEGRSV